MHVKIHQHSQQYFKRIELSPPISPLWLNLSVLCGRIFCRVKGRTGSRSTRASFYVNQYSCHWPKRKKGAKPQFRPLMGKYSPVKDHENYGISDEISPGVAYGVRHVTSLCGKPEYGGPAVINIAKQAENDWLWDMIHVRLMTYWFLSWKLAMMIFLCHILFHWRSVHWQKICNENHLHFASYSNYFGTNGWPYMVFRKYLFYHLMAN